MPLSKKAATEMIPRFAEAVRAHEMKGAQPPEERDEIIHEYRKARSDLAVHFHRALDELSVTKGEAELLTEKLKDTERRLAEANALLDKGYHYTKDSNLGKLGQSRVKALIDDHQEKTRFMWDIVKAHNLGDPEVHRVINEKRL